MELILPIVLLIFVVVSGGFYLSDPSGWNSTIKRLSTITRANLEARKNTTQALEKLPVKDAKKAWEDEFAGKDLVLADETVKHVIIRHDYYQSTYGPWPRWTCKCGASKHYVADGIIWFTHREASRGGRQHIKRMEMMDRRLEGRNGEFAF